MKDIAAATSCDVDSDADTQKDQRYFDSSSTDDSILDCAADINQAGAQDIAQSTPLPSAAELGDKLASDDVLIAMMNAEPAAIAKETNNQC